MAKPNEIPSNFPGYSFFRKYPYVFSGVIQRGTTNTIHPTIIKFRDKTNSYYFLESTTNNVMDINKNSLGRWQIENDENFLVIKPDNTQKKYLKANLSSMNAVYESNEQPKKKEEKPKKEEPVTKKEEPVTKKEEPVQDLKKTKPEFDWDEFKKSYAPIAPAKPNIDCTEWTVNNLFETNFKEEFKEQAAKDFVKWYVGRKPNFLSKYDGVCGFTSDGIFKQGETHKNGLVKFMSRIPKSNQPNDTQFNFWLKEYQNTNKDKFKENVTMKENVMQKLKSIKETKSLKESLINKLKDKKNQKKIHETKIERELFKLQESYDRKNKTHFYSNFGSLISRYKKSSLYLTENVDQTFKDAFKFVFSENDKQIKKETISRLFKSLGIEERTQIANEISEKLMSMETTEIYLNCLKVSSIILSTMITSITTELSSETTGSLEGMVKSVINTSLNSSDNMEKLKYQINNVVCPVLDGYATKIVDMPKEISNAFTNMI